MTDIDRIPNISRLLLPGVLPHPKALASHNQNDTNYHPDIWELQYVALRYLSRIDDDNLRRRYCDIVRNMRAIISPDRHVIPIQSFLSSWYWYRKEHQTRLELAIRGLSPPCEPPVIVPPDLSAAPARPRSPNCGDVLFRYGERRWLKEMVDFGRLRIKAATLYSEMETDLSRHDNEKIKESYMPGQYVIITLPDGGTVKPIGDVNISVEGTDYFVYCVSNDWDANLFIDFNVDACVIIHNPDEFARRLNAAAIPLSDWYFHYNPVSYFDPYERYRHENIDNVMSKDFRFAYQRETRFIWAGFGRDATGHLNLELGPLADIATYIEYP